MKKLFLFVLIGLLASCSTVNKIPEEAQNTLVFYNPTPGLEKASINGEVYSLTITKKASKKVKDVDYDYTYQKIFDMCPTNSLEDKKSNN